MCVWWVVGGGDLLKETKEEKILGQGENLSCNSVYTLISELLCVNSWGLAKVIQGIEADINRAL